MGLLDYGIFEAKEDGESMAKEKNWFKEICPELADTELYGQLSKRAEADHAFLTSVEKLCYDGVVLSKDVIRFFPTFTLHDGTHIKGVCRWMAQLLGRHLDDLTAEEAAMLLLAACWHDSGMCMKDEQRAQFEEELRAEERPEDWKRYFHRHPGDEVMYSKSRGLKEEERRTFMDGLLRRFIRENHPARACGTMEDWPDALLRHGLQKDALASLCRSHGEKLESSYGTAVNCDLNLCVVLLRLAAALDYDASRTPDVLFHQLGLDEPETAEQVHSRKSWLRTGAGGFGEISERAIPYTACFETPQLEHDVVSYLNWLQGELLICGEFLASFAGRWQTLPLPQKIVQNITRKGYKAGGFQLTMDQDRVLKLLTGRALYSDPGVLVRELLQNAVDAVLMRRRVDPRFGEKDGKIVIRTWTEGSECWFRIEDNGVGMDEHILMDYFLKVGRSYYTSDEFRAALLHEVRNTGFQPTSRFGIGILSCFMSDSKNTVEVETRYYSSETGRANPVLRLQVTGLHGYYILTEPTRDNPGEKLHRPTAQNCGADGYLRGVGTTICTRVNLFNLGGMQSIKELVDKYLCYPEVKVEYYGEEGHVSYPTQEELMAVIHRLSGDNPTEPTPHIHPLSDELFQKLNWQLPGARWSEKPALVLRYYALDQLSDTGRVLGVAIRAELQVSVAFDPLIIDGETYELEIEVTTKRVDGTNANALSFTVSTANDALNTMGNSFEQIFDAKARLLSQEFRDDFPDIIDPENVDEIFAEYYFFEEIPTELRREIEELRKLARSVRRYKEILKSGTIILSSAELTTMLSQDERWILSCVRQQRDILRTSKENGDVPLTVTAFNGILADTENLLGKNDSYLGVALLLRGEQVPEVNLARDSILALPLDLACDLSMTAGLLPGMSYPWNGPPEAIGLTHFVTLPSTAYWELLRQHPDWEGKMKLGRYTLAELERQHQEAGDDKKVEITLSAFHRTLPDMLFLSTLRRRFSLIKDMSSMSNPTLIGKRDEPELNDFPPCLFFHPKSEDAPFAMINSYGFINYYNLEHPFSQWLIQQHESLQEKVPEQYQLILEAMILGKGADTIRVELNSIMKNLCSFPGNPFTVPERLELKESDFC